MSATKFNPNQIGPNTSIVRQNYTATEAQTTFVTAQSFSGATLYVYVGGSLLTLNADYTVSGSDTVILNTALAAGVLVSIVIETLTIPGAPQLPTRQVLTSGSGTYNTPVGARQLRIRMVGGGGGGGATNTTDGTDGEASSFNSITASGGIKGIAGVTGTGGLGGVGGIGTASLRIGGGAGTAAAGGKPGSGGNSVFGGGAGHVPPSTAGNSGAANSGGGGGGGAGVSDMGGGGGGAEYVEIIINSPASTYPYTVGAGGAGGATPPAGGAGGSGIIIVDEIYG